MVVAPLLVIMGESPVWLCLSDYTDLFSQSIIPRLGGSNPNAPLLGAFL
jgi:hypothetical protein